MTARAAVLADLQKAGLSTPRANAHIDRLLQEHAHDLGERLRNVGSNGEGAAWNWWDAAVIPGECANLIDPPANAALCGKTRGISTSVPYKPCARPAGHPEAYCRDAKGDHLFLAMPEEAHP